MFLLKDAMQLRQWGSNPRSLSLVSQALFHWAIALPQSMDEKKTNIKS